MGDSLAAEAHLNGLFTLIDMRRPEDWQHRFYGMLQRVILMAGSFIAASKPSSSHLETRLSPFYLSSTPGMEACKADVEGEVLINALARLTAICYRGQEAGEIHPRNAETTATLLQDTQTYIARLLFKPHAPCVGIESSSPRKQQNAYHNLPQALFYPSSSRAWATAAWLYLHFVLRPLTSKAEQLDPRLLRLVLDTLRADTEANEQAMHDKAYSVELWGWKVVVGLYALKILGDDPSMGVYIESPVQRGFDRCVEIERARERGKELEQDLGRWEGGHLAESSGSSTSAETSDDEEEDIGATKQPQKTQKEWIGAMKFWFSKKLAVWSGVAKLDDCRAAIQMLRRILWPEEEADFEGDAAMEEIWSYAVVMGGYNDSGSEEGGYETQGSPSVPIDPLPWE